MQNRTLTSLEAYDAMFLFLERRWELTGRGNTELSLLLSGMARRKGHVPSDPVFFDDWEDAIDIVLKDKRS